VDRTRDLGLPVFRVVERAAALVLDLVLVMGSSEVHATPSVALPQPRPGKRPAGQDPEAGPAAPSHHSNAPNKPESQSILSKIVAHWIDGLPPDPGRACLLLSGHWKAARQLRFQSTISRFESLPAPARQSDNWRLLSHKAHKLPSIAGFFELAAGLQIPTSHNSEAKMPTVSGGCLKYSRFWETATGD
jgi:hypothetical protein